MPSSGIPKDDLANSVQASLEKADTLYDVVTITKPLLVGTE